MSPGFISSADIAQPDRERTAGKRIVVDFQTVLMILDGWMGIFSSCELFM